MNVQEVMTRTPRTCRSGDSLVSAAKVLWDHDCGAVPVVDDAGRPVGIVTDRDCCMAAYTRGRRFDEITVASAMANVLFTVRADEPLQNAVAIMQQRQVRRLPVIDAQGRLCGILSLADVARAGRAVAPAAVAEAFSAITSRRAPAAAPIAEGKREPTAVVVPKAPAATPTPPPAAAASAPASMKAKGRGKKK